MGTPTKLRAQQADVDKTFAMDEAKEANGVDINYGSLVLRIARTGGANKEFARIWEEMTRPYARMIEAGVDIPEQVAEEIAHKAYAQGVVKGWNLYNGEEEVPCTEENIIAQFKRNPEMFQFVFNEARRAANFRKATLEGEAKN